jgi:hypothetical protein
LSHIHNIKPLKELLKSQQSHILPPRGDKVKIINTQKTNFKLRKNVHILLKTLPFLVEKGKKRLLCKKT